jgi:hypothetical protein
MSVDEQDPDLEDTVGNLKHAQHSIEVATFKINSARLAADRALRSVTELVVAADRTVVPN